MKSKRELSLLLVLILFFSSISFGASTLEEDELLINHPYKIINIYLTEEINKNTVDTSSVIIDNNFSYSIGFKDNYTISILPGESYQENIEYSLTLTDKIESISGENLKEFTQIIKLIDTKDAIKQRYSSVIEDNVTVPEFPNDFDGDTEDTEDIDDEPVDDTTDTNTDESSDETIDELADDTDDTDDTDDESADEPVDDTTDDTTDESIDDTADEPVDDATDEPVDDMTDEPVGDTDDEPVDDTTNEPNDGTDDESSNEPTDDIADDTIDDTDDESTDELADDTTNDPIDDTTDEPMDDTTDEPVDDTTDESVDDTTDEPVDNTTDEPVDDTTDEPVNDTTDESVDDMTDEPVFEVREKTLLKYSELSRYEKIAHNILLDMSNLKETIYWGEALTMSETDEVFKYLDNQKNHNPFSNLDNSKYIFELSEDKTEWLTVGMENIEYLVDDNEMENLNNKYTDIFNTFELEGKTNKEIGEIIALELVKHFDYSSTDPSSNKERIYYQSYFSILRDETVCAGYTGAYSHLLNLAGIRNDFITVIYHSSNGESIAHVYNKVYLSDDEIVYTDVTHMDQSTEENPYNYREKFLNNTDQFFNEPNKREYTGLVKLLSTEISHIH